MGLIGKRYDGGMHLVEREPLESYARATEDTNPAYHGPDAIAPPMFHVRLMWPLLEQLAADPELGLDRLRLVHGEHAMNFHRPLRAGDQLAISAELVSLQDKPSGRVVTFALEGKLGEEQALSGSTTYFIRPAVQADKRSAPKTPEPEPEPPTLVTRQHIPREMPSRYADASGDHNPIHLDEAVARAAGLPGVILHGLCTMALAARDIVSTQCGGNPARLRSISVRFARPVFPGGDLSLEIWRNGNELAFTTRNERGEAVIVNGRATTDGV